MSEEQAQLVYKQTNFGYGFHFPKVTRVEVIDHGGRSYTNTVAGDVEIQMQDDGRTLKVFTKGSGH
jgi:hypothetical protein